MVILLGGIAVVGSTGNVPLWLSIGYAGASASALTFLAAVAYRRRAAPTRFGVAGTTLLLAVVWLAVFVAAFTSVDFSTGT